MDRIIGPDTLLRKKNKIRSTAIKKRGYYIKIKVGLPVYLPKTKKLMKIFKTDDFKTINKYTLSFNSFKINKL